MKLLNPNITKISLALLLAWGTAAHAEVVGRVLVSVGDNVALRAGKEVKLAAGTPVETGDTLRVGDASNLQVRFTDEAIMALRPNSSVRIDDYAFANKAESDKSVFSLLKGGLRTITGVIGRNSRSNYAVKTETATIGIRGTHYNLVDCKNDCRNLDGTPGENGTFGGVTDGRISATNNAGEREFGKNEFFHILSRNDLPVSLISPPGFLRDRLEGQAKSRSKDKAPTAGVGSETSQTTQNTNTSTQLSIAPTTLITLPADIDTYVPADQPVITASTILDYSYIPDFGFINIATACSGYPCTATFSGVHAYTERYSWSSSYYSPYPGYSYTDSGAGEDGWSGSNLNGVITLSGPPPYYDYSYVSPGHTGSESLQLEPVEFGSNRAGNMIWTRVREVGTYTWSYTDPSDPTNTASGIETWSGWNHLITGDPAVPMPTSGQYAFNWVGGTSPTDSLGNVGTITSGGTWNVVFSNGSFSMGTTSPVKWSVGGVNYELSAAQQAVPVSSMSVGGSNYSGTGYYPQISGTLSCPTAGCTVVNEVYNNAGSPVSNTISPTFFGANAQAMGVGYAASVKVNNVLRYTGHAQAYAR